jgi:hypothetical protein
MSGDPDIQQFWGGILNVYPGWDKTRGSFSLYSAILPLSYSFTCHPQILDWAGMVDRGDKRSILFSDEEKKKLGPGKST